MSTKKKKFGTITFRGGKYEGNLYHGIPHGEGQVTFANGDRYIGSFQLGKSDGNGEFFGETPEGKFHYKGQFKNDKMHGKGRYEFSNGDTFDGGFHEGKFSGEGLYIFTTGELYSGQFVDGKREGNGKYQSQLRTYIGLWKDDLRHGKGLEMVIGKGRYEGYWYEGMFIQLVSILLFPFFLSLFLF